MEKFLFIIWQKNIYIKKETELNFSFMIYYIPHSWFLNVWIMKRHLSILVSRALPWTSDWYMSTISQRKLEAYKKEKQQTINSFLVMLLPVSSWMGLVLTALGVALYVPGTWFLPFKKRCIELEDLILGARSFDWRFIYYYKFKKQQFLQVKCYKWNTEWTGK